jgi:hypothetical protein
MELGISQSKPRQTKRIKLLQSSLIINAVFPSVPFMEFQLRMVGNLIEN